MKTFLSLFYTDGFVWVLPQMILVKIYGTLYLRSVLFVVCYAVIMHEQFSDMGASKTMTKYDRVSAIKNMYECGFV